MPRLSRWLPFMIPPRAGWGARTSPVIMTSVRRPQVSGGVQVAGVRDHGQPQRVTLAFYLMPPEDDSRAIAYSRVPGVITGSGGRLTDMSHFNTPSICTSALQGCTIPLKHSSGLGHDKTIERREQATPARSIRRRTREWMARVCTNVRTERYTEDDAIRLLRLWADHAAS